MPLLEILSMIAGAIYGYVKPGKEDRFELFKRGVMIGVIFGLVFTVLGMLVEIEFLLISSMIGLIVFSEIIIIAIFFIIGTYIGDWFEERGKRHDDRPWK